jgi:hypothetical protein
MADLRMDMTTHDLVLPLVAATPQERVAQAVWLRLKTQRGSYAFAIDMGMPWIELSQQKTADLGIVGALACAEAMKVRGVKGARVDSISLDASTRELSCTLSIETDYGLVEVSL